MQTLKNAIDVAELEIVQRDVGRSVWHVEEEQIKLRAMRKLPANSTAKQDSFKLKDHGTPTMSSSSPGRGASDECQKNLLSAIIHSVVGTNNLHASSERDRLHYYQGFHDVCALFHINLASSAITSSVISQLTLRHFRDAMQINFSTFVRGIQLTFWPLLSQIDPEMDAHLFYCHAQAGAETRTADELDTPVSVISWTMTWFASHLGNDVHVASRLVDAFLASHALFPIYVVVAFLLHSANRADILECECDFASMHMQLVYLPKKAFQAVANSAAKEELIQEIIDAAISYMKRAPPRRLVELAKTYRKGLLLQGNQKLSHTDIAMFDSPPSWSITPSAPTNSILERTESINAMDHEQLRKIIGRKLKSSQNKKNAKSKGRMRITYSSKVAVATLKSEKDTRIQGSKKEKWWKVFVYIPGKPHSLARVASGFEDSLRRTKNRKSRLLLWGGLITVSVASGGHLRMMYQRSSLGTYFLSLHVLRHQIHQRFAVGENTKPMVGRARSDTEQEEQEVEGAPMLSIEELPSVDKFCHETERLDYLAGHADRQGNTERANISTDADDTAQSSEDTFVTVDGLGPGEEDGKVKNEMTHDLVETSIDESEDVPVTVDMLTSSEEQGNADNEIARDFTEGLVVERQESQSKEADEDTSLKATGRKRRIHRFNHIRNLLESLKENLLSDAEQIVL